MNQELAVSWVAPVEQGAGSAVGFILLLTCLSQWIGAGAEVFLAGVEVYNLQLGTTAGGSQIGDYSYTKDSPRAIFSGLTLGARYYVRIRAKNTVGYGNWTENYSRVIAGDLDHCSAL